MPRARRAFVAGGIYHVVTRGNRKQPIFLSDADRELFCEIVRRVVQKHGWSVHSYCLMPNHYHLLLETPHPDLSAGMQRINGMYGTWFNRLHGFVGHVFQGRFKASPVENDGHLLHLTRYIALNPVRARLCWSPSDWPWGSFQEVMSQSEIGLTSPAKMLAFFSEDQHRAREIFRRFVEDGSGR